MALDWPVASALRRALAQGYGIAELRADLLSGLVVGIVALPLSMALAIAIGVAPQYGLYTAIVAGTVAALLGGSKVQVTGPTATFVVVLAPVVSRFGLGGLLLATFLAGLMLLAFGLARFGRFIEFVPHPVTSGFTAGIAIVIGLLQVRDLLGLAVGDWPAHFVDRLLALLSALPTARASEAAIGLLTLAVLLLWPRLTRRIPAPLAALSLAGLAAWLAAQLWPGFEVATLGSRFFYEVDGVRHGGVPPWPPLPLWPWRLGGAGGQPLVLSFDLLRDLLPTAFAIAMLGAIESLLSAVVADGMTGKKHDPDAELVAQGAANLVAPFFGGFAATGALARTATNVRAGARSPIAAVVHAHVVLLSMLALAPLLAYLPMAALAALLLVVAWNMGEAKHVALLLRRAPKSEARILLLCLGLTVVFDMVVAVTAGVVLAAMQFIQRMADVAETRPLGADELPGERPLPPGLVVYSVGGPLFFGAAERAMSALHTVGKEVRAVVLDLRAVPVVDATGLVALDSLRARLEKDRILMVLAGVQRQPLRALARAGYRNRPGGLAIGRSFERALETARAHLEKTAPPSPSRRSDRSRGRR